MGRRLRTTVKLGLGAVRLLRAVVAVIALVALVAFIYVAEARNHAHERPPRGTVLKVNSESVAFIGDVTAW